MSVHIPEKLLVGKITQGTTTVTSYWSGGTYDGAPLIYQATFEIQSVAAGYPGYYTNSNLYNANDVEVGFQFLLPNGKWYDIVGVTGVTDNEATLQFRDTDLRILTSDANNDPPNNGPDENISGILCPVVNGVAQLSNLAKFAGAFPIDSYWVDDMQAAGTNYIVANGGGGSGTNGTSGTSGESGTSGSSGSSGTSGESGTSGSSGTSGESGTSGTSGTSGSNGSSGTSGDSLFISGAGFYYTTNNLEVTGSVKIKGTLTADEYNVSVVSSSILFSSGSTKFGDTQDDTHVFTGSMVTSGSLTVNGDLTVNGTSILKAIDNRESLIVSGAMNIVTNNVNASVVSASLAFEGVKVIEQIINTTTMDLGYF